MKSELTLRGPKVAIIADLHMGVHQNSVEWQNIVNDFGHFLAQDLKQKKIDTIFILGDLLHYRDEIAVNTIHSLSVLLQYWKDFQIVIFPGNHDCYFKDNSEIHSLSILKGYPNIVVLDTLTTVDLYGKTCTFCPWGTTPYDIPLSDFIFGHFEISSFKLNEYKTCEEGISPRSLLSKSRNIFSGHFHTRQVRGYDQGTITYVGSPYHMDFGDHGERGYHILNIDTEEIEFIENKLSPKHIVVKTSENNWRDPELENHFVKLIIDTEDAEDPEKLIKEICDYKPRNITVDYNIKNKKIQLETEIEFTNIHIENSIRDFVENLDIKNKKEVADYTINLYNKVK